MSQTHTWPDINPLINIDGLSGLNSMVNDDANGDFRHTIGSFGFSAKLHAMRSIDLFIDSRVNWLSKATNAIKFLVKISFKIRVRPSEVNNWDLLKHAALR